MFYVALIVLLLCLLITLYFHHKYICNEIEELKELIKNIKLSDSNNSITKSSLSVILSDIFCFNSSTSSFLYMAIPLFYSYYIKKQKRTKEKRQICLYRLYLEFF